PPGRAAAAVLEHPDRTVRPLLDLADTLPHGETLGLARPLAVEDDAHERLRREPADERAAAPVRELVAVVEHQARRRDHRVPRHRRRCEVRPRRVIRNRAAAVMVALGDERIPVVRAAAHEIELVAAARPHLDVPQTPLGVEREPERVAVPERPDLGGNAPTLGERVVVRHRAVVAEADDLAEIRIEVLRRIEFLSLAGADPEEPFAERDAMPEMAVSRDFRHLAPDDLEVLERAAALVEHETRPRDGGPARARFAGLGIAQIHETVLAEVRMQDDVAESALTAVRDARHARDLADPAVRRPQLQPTALLGDEQPAVRQERHGPRLVERRDLRHDERVVLREHRVVAAGRGEQRPAEISRSSHGPPSSSPAARRSRPATAGTNVRRISLSIRTSSRARSSPYAAA